MKIVELNEIANKVVSGTVISRVECRNNEIKVGEVDFLPLKSITCGMIDMDEVKKIDIAKQVQQEKMTNYGDIILKMNQPYDSVYVEREFSGLLIPSFCCLLRTVDRTMVDPYYLVSYLNSKFAKEYLMTSNRASAASLLKIGDIKKLPIPLPDLSEQIAIGKIFMSCSERQVILSKMKKYEMELVENIVMDAVREVFEHEKY
ncbi:MAG: restriction endonuclease subunit S [Anaerostipes sp.]|nr:restriction endonuclease subunit S [Anaerostipes sp.]